MTVIRQEKGAQRQTLRPDIFRWGGGLPREGVGVKKFGMSLETHGKQTVWRDIPLRFPNAVVLNAVGRRNTQMSAKERKCKSAKQRKRAQKGAKECKRMLPRKNCKQPGLKQPGLGTPKSQENCRKISRAHPKSSRTKSLCSIFGP